MKLALLVLFIWSTLQTVSAFYGGGFTYSVLSEKNGYYKTKLVFLNGWRLGNGPCYNCTDKDIGLDVTDRKHHHSQNWNEFGRWQLEFPLVHFILLSTPILVGNSSYVGYLKDDPDITFYMYNNSRDEALMLSQHDGWDMVRSEAVIDIPFAGKRNQLDINYWIGLRESSTLVPKEDTAHLQAKMFVGVRSDTGKLNSGPVTLIKPFYSVEVDKHHEIKIPSIDVDEDVVRCKLASFVEAAGLERIMDYLEKDQTLTLNEKTCTLHLFTNSSKMRPGDTFDIAFNVRDYPKRNLLTDTVSALDGHHKHRDDNRYFLSSIVYRMHFVVTTRTDPPVFISPSPPNNQHYTVYIGAEFKISVYAKPSQQRHIAKFDVIRSDGKPVKFTGVHPLLHDQNNVSFTNISWEPTAEDVGKYIICVNVEDNLGFSSVDMLCLLLYIKHLDVDLGTMETRKPQFFSSGELICEIDTVCIFPVYVTTTNEGGVKNLTVEGSPSSEENVTLTMGQTFFHQVILTKVVNVEFSARQPRKTRICLTARDSKTSATRCYEAIVQTQDPCEENPCLHGGICVPSKDLKNFTCICSIRTSGSLCEIAVREENHCVPDPCFGNTSVCLQVPTKDPYFWCTKCPLGKTGYRCQLNVDPCGRNPCSNTEICKLTSSDSYLCLKSGPNSVPGCNPRCVRSSNMTCAMDKRGHPSCICAYGLSPNGMCNTDLLSTTFSSIKSNEGNKLTTQFHSIFSVMQPHFVQPTPGPGSTIACDFGMPECTFAMYIFSRPFPKLTILYADGLPFHTPLKVVVNTTHISHLWRAVVQFKNPSHTFERIKEYDICLNAEKYHTFGIEITDQRCFHIVINSTVHREYSRNTTCQFTATETPQYDSIIGCQRGTECHFFVYTHPVNGKCNEVYTDNQYISVFSPVIDQTQALCTHNIAYTNTSTTGQSKICLKPCENGSVRCYTMNVIDDDRCSPNPCLNDGVCLDPSDGEIKCYCQNDTILGKFCEKVFVPDCKTSRKCDNNAGCYSINESEELCVCRLGYAGDNCHLDANENLTSLAVNGGIFQGLAMPSRVQCFLSYPCIIPFTVIRLPFKSPHVVPGYISPVLEVRKVEVHAYESRPAGVIDQGTIEVVGSSLGEFKLCLQSIEEGRGTIADELCFTVNVREGFYLQEDKTVPHFVEPTLSDGGHVQCLLHRPCHLTLWAVNDALTNHCPILSADKTFDSGVFILNPLNSSSQPCLYDVVVEANQALNTSICFSLTNDNAVYNPKELEDRRCYMVLISQSVSVQGLCIGVTCLNNAMCDGHGTTANCVCPLGFSGNNCSKEYGLSHADNLSYYKPPLFTNLVLPKLYYCPLNRECQIQFSVKSKHSVYFTTNSDPKIVQVQSINQRKVSEDSLATITVIHHQQGSHQMCVALSAGKYSSETDKVCFMVVSPFYDSATGKQCEDLSPDDCSDLSALINVCADAGTAIFCAKSCGLCGNPIQDFNIRESLFLAPTPYNSSSFLCSPAKECHVELYLRQTSGRTCPKVFSSSSSEVSILLGDYCGCVVDMVLAPAQAGHKETVCLHAKQSSMTENRCFDVVFKQHYAAKQISSVITTITTKQPTTPNVNILSGNIIG